MGTEKMTKASGIGLIYKVPAILFLAFMVYYTVMMLLAPAGTLNRMEDEYGFRQDENNTADERILTDSAYLKLLKEKGFLQSRIAMAETDSIYLTVDLTDSIANLEISGVEVHTAEIKKMKISRILKHGNDYIISTMLSRPLNIAREYSSIQKEPLMIKMAPRDTSEFVPDIIPDTADYEPVNFILEMDNGIVISVYQEEKLNQGDAMNLFGFDLRYRIKNSIRSLASVFTLKVPEYHPFIKLRLTREDAKIIYRALPKKGQIAVCL
jgi:hypothetical protein